MPPALALPIAQAAIGVGQAVIGGIQAARARKELEGLEQPFYEIQQELSQNRNLAAQQAQLGVPQATMDYMTAETQRGLGTSIDAIRQTDGSPNAVADLFAAYQRGIQQNAATDAQMRVQNLGRFMQENEKMAGQKTMQWVINEFQPFQNKTRMLQQRIGQGNQMLSGGLNTMLSAGASYATASQNQDLLNAYKGSINKGNVEPFVPFSTSEVRAGINQTGLQQALDAARGLNQADQNTIMSRNVYSQPMQNFG